MTIERRTAARHTAFVAAEIEVEGAVIACGITRNASVSGVQVLTHRAFFLGTRVTLLVYLPVMIPGEGSPESPIDSAPRRLAGAVVRTNSIAPEDSNLWSVALGVALDAPCPDLDAHLRQLAQSQESISSPPPSRERPRDDGRSS